MRTPFHEGLAYASIVGSVGVIAFALMLWSEASPILLALSPIGIFTGRRMLNLMRNPESEHMGWFYTHMGSMLGDRCSVVRDDLGDDSLDGIAEVRRFTRQHLVGYASE